jgi:hypothetical protein
MEDTMKNKSQEIRLVIGEDGKFTSLPHPYTTIEVETEKDFQRIKKAIEKSLEKEIYCNNKTHNFHCPECNKVLSVEDKYCSKCGQKLNIKGITKEMLFNAYVKGWIELKNSPHNDGVVCYIGEEWFYFGGHEAENSSIEEYKKNFDKETIVNDIFEVLENFRKTGEGFAESYLNCLNFIQNHSAKNLHSMSVRPSKPGTYLVAYGRSVGDKVDLYETEYDGDGWCFVEESPVGWYSKNQWGKLWDAELNCDHDIHGASGGGVKCSKCSAWCCL